MLKKIIFQGMFFVTSLTSCAMELEAVAMPAKEIPISSAPMQRRFMHNIHVGNITAVHELIKEGAVEVNTVFKLEKDKRFDNFHINNRLPLTLAIEYDHKTIAGLLLARKANPDVFSGSENNAVRTCVSALIKTAYYARDDWEDLVRDKIPMLQLLLSYNASYTKAQENDKNTLFHDIANKLGHTETLFNERLTVVFALVLKAIQAHHDALYEITLSPQTKSDSNIKMGG